MPHTMPSATTLTLATWQRALAYILVSSLNDCRQELASKLFYALDTPQLAMLYMILLQLDGCIFIDCCVKKVLGLEEGLGFCRVYYKLEELGDVLVKPFLLPVELCSALFAGIRMGNTLLYNLPLEAVARRLHITGRVPVPPQALVPPPYSPRDPVTSAPLPTPVETTWQTFVKQYKRPYKVQRCDYTCTTMLNAARAAERHLFEQKDKFGAAMRLRAALEAQQLQDIRDPTHSGHLCDEALKTIAKVAAHLPSA